MPYIPAPVRILIALALLSGVPGLRAEEAAPDPLLSSDPARIQEFVTKAYGQGLHQVTIPPGTYRLAVPANAPRHLTFAKMNDFEIVATGVTLVFTDRTKSAMAFQHCRNVTFRGAKLTRETIPFSQGRVLAVSGDGSAIDVQVAKGYPLEFDDPKLFPDIFLNRYDAQTHLWQEDLFPAEGKQVERLGPDSFRFYPRSRVRKGGPVVPGVPMAWRGTVLPDIDFVDCEAATLAGVTIERGAGFCVHEGSGPGGNYFNYDIVFGPKPPDAEEEPLFASNADGFHSDGARKGPTLEDCHFTGMDDDGIAIHGSYGMVQESSAAGSRITAALTNPGWCRPGDSLRLIDERGVLMEEAKVVSVKPLPDYQPATLPPPEFKQWQNLARPRYMEVTLDHDTAAKFTWLLENASAEGSGFVARRCTIRDHRGRGFLIKAGDGLIEDCTVEQNAMGGIEVSPEMAFWNEAGYSQHLVIRRNVLRNVGYVNNPGYDQAGSLSVSAHEYGHYVPLPGGHRDILVEGNLFENDSGPNVVFTSVQGAVLRDNRFVHPMWAADQQGRATGVDSDALIWMTECSGVNLSGNTLAEPGPFMKKRIDATATATGAGLEDGVGLSGK